VNEIFFYLTAEGAENAEEEREEEREEEIKNSNSLPCGNSLFLPPVTSVTSATQSVAELLSSFFSLTND